jgi:hypothetical protein
MDEGLARGVCRQHLRTAVPSGDERSSRLSSLVIGLSEKLSSGRALTNPTAAMAAWRRVVSDGPIIEVGKYCEATAFVPRWQTNHRPMNHRRGREAADRPDEPFYRMAVMADALSVDRREMTFMSAAAAITADQHVLRRWLERQPDADAGGMEAAIIGLVPLATAMAQFVSLLGSKEGTAVVLPMGDGVLVGTCEYMETPYDGLGVWSRIDRKNRTTRRFRTLGTALPNDNGSYYVQGITYYGPWELSERLSVVRQRLLDWRDEFKDTMSLDRLAGKAIEGDVLNDTTDTGAFDALHDIMVSDEWENGVFAQGQNNYIARQKKHSTNTVQQAPVPRH